MTFARSAPAVTISVVAAVLVSMAVASNRLFASLTEQIEADRFALMHAVATKSVADVQDKALGYAELVARLSSTGPALAAGDRDALVRELVPAIDLQRERFGVRQAGFVIPPATMLLRLHKPNDPAEDVSSFRPILVAANETKQALKGSSIGRSGPSIVGVAPISDAAGNHAGVIEFGFDYGPVLDGIKSSYGLDAAVFFEERPLREFATGLGGEVFTESNRVGEYVRFHTTNADRMASLVTDRDLSSDEPQMYVRRAFGVPYGVVVLPIQNHSGKRIGQISVAADFSSSRASASRMVAWQALMVLIGTVVCAGAILVAIRGLVLRPMEHLAVRMAALASGDRTQAVDAEALGLCDEMAGLAESYEALRKGGSGS